MTDETSPIVDWSEGNEDTSQEEDNEPILLCQATLQIVGIRYYKGVAHPGEYVNLIREPHNPYDRNAIRVDNIHGEQVGHIKATMARSLALIMDEMSQNFGCTSIHDAATPQSRPYGGLCKIDAFIPSAGNTFSIPLALKFYGTDSSALTSIKMSMKYSGAVVVSAESIMPKNVKTKKITVKDWRSQSELDEMFDKQKALLNSISAVEQPSQLITKLLPHQIVGLSWMVHRETATHEHIFFKRVKEKKRNVWLSEITNASQMTEPPQVRGGLLCDEMGMGKSLTCLALILANPPTGVTYSEPPPLPPPAAKRDSVKAIEPAENEDENPAQAEDEAVPKTKRRRRTSKKGENKKDQKPARRPSKPKAAASSKQAAQTFSQDSKRTTLIVCPVSVASNWVDQVGTHVHPDILRVEVYQGPERYGLLDEVQSSKVDILITSYNTLGVEYAAEFGGKKVSNKRKHNNSIFSIHFHRIILDESHTIRNAATLTSKACLKLCATNRFGITGTPLQNKPDDICPLFHFLRLEPFGQSDIFRRAITQPIRDGDDVGLTRLRAIMCHVGLRRTKKGEGIELPKRTVQICKVQFPKGSVHERIYDSLFESARTAFGAMLRGGEADALREYLSILETLLRIRQACCAGALIPKERIQRAEEALAGLKNRMAPGAKPLSAKEGADLLRKLQGAFSDDGAGGTAECAVCLEDFPQERAVILRTCSHVYCHGCVRKLAGMQNSTCPLCRLPFQKTDVVKISTATNAANSDLETKMAPLLPSDGQELSPKIVALLKSIDEDMKPDEKGVIFSQFTSFLDMIGNALQNKGYNFVRIDGSMRMSDRINAMKSFNADDDSNNNNNNNNIPRFILCSLRAAGTGINLTRGNHCFLMDLWWNKAVEDQACDRIHRIGQSRDVRIVKFVMDGSIEERIIEMQEAKAAIGKGTMEKLSPEELRCARISALKNLFLITPDS